MRIFTHSDYKLTRTISSLAAFFLYDIIKKHFEPKVLGLGGFPIKNRLQTIYDWNVSYDFFAHISLISINAMKSVNLRRISQLNEPQMMATETQQQHPQQEDIDTILRESFEDFLL